MDLLQEIWIKEVPPGLFADDFVVLEPCELFRDSIENENDTLHVARDDPVKGVLNEVFLKIVRSLQVFLRDYDQGLYRNYWSLVTTNYISANQ